MLLWEEMLMRVLMMLSVLALLSFPVPTVLGDEKDAPKAAPAAEGPKPISNMWHLELHWAELVLRSVFVYFFLLIILRVTGKRQIGQLAPFDLVLLLVLSNAVQNAMNGGDNSYTAGVILASTLIFTNYLVSLATYRFKWLEGLVEGRPSILIHNGKLDEKAMRDEKLTHHELMAALRDAGCSSIDQVHIAIMENNGRISILPRHGDRTIHGLPHGEKTVHGPAQIAPDGNEKPRSP